MYKIDEDIENQQNKLSREKIDELMDELKNIKDFNERRNYLRMTIVNIFGEEKPGEESLKEYKYNYIIDKVNNNNEDFKLIVERPAHFFKGFDFLINISKNSGDNEIIPSHHDVKLDIIKIYKYSKEIYFWLIEKIRKIYYIEAIDYDDVRKKQKYIEMANRNFDLKLKNLELLLKTIEWFFIEQDIRFWYGLGRKYIYNFFVAPIFEINRNGNNIAIKHYKNEKECAFWVNTSCSKDIRFDKEFYYSTDEYHDKKTMYLENKNISSYIKLKKRNSTDDSINISEKGIKRILGFENNIWIYVNDNNNLINEINGFLVKENDYMKLLSYMKETHCIIILKGY